MSCWMVSNDDTKPRYQRDDRVYQENIAALNNPVDLTDDDMAQIAALDRNFRYFRPEDWWGSIGAVFD